MGYERMAKYRRIQMPAPFHEEIRQYVKKNQNYRSMDQICREAAEALIKEHNLKDRDPQPGRNKTRWKSANIPLEHYQKIQAWIQTGESPYASVNEALRDAIRNTILRQSENPGTKMKKR